MVSALDAAISLFGEDIPVPTMEQVARRAGLSLRSLYRYFPDAEALSAAAADRALERGRRLAVIEGDAEGELPDRLHRFVTNRLRLHDAMGATYFAAVHHGRTNFELDGTLRRARELLRGQMEGHFAPELEGRDPLDRQSVVVACDTLVQFESLRAIRRELPALDDAVRVLEIALERLLTCGSSAPRG